MDEPLLFLALKSSITDFIYEMYENREGFRAVCKQGRWHFKIFEFHGVINAFEVQPVAFCNIRILLVAF